VIEMIKIPVSSKEKEELVRKAGFEPVYISEPTPEDKAELERLKELFLGVPAQKALNAILTALVITGK
tara:strand:- start:5194 stop:5397 length:204 start_codon:yes stop_codon:yes gene_type:complete